MILPVEVSDNARQSRSDVFSDNILSVKGAYLSPAIYILVKWFMVEKNVHVRFQCEEKENKTRIRKKVSIYIPKVADFFTMENVNCNYLLTLNE